MSFKEIKVGYYFIYKGIVWEKITDKQAMKIRKDFTNVIFRNFKQSEIVEKIEEELIWEV